MRAMALCASAKSTPYRSDPNPGLFHSRYFPRSAVRALYDIVRIEGARSLVLVRGEQQGPVRHRSPVMWIELREVAWLASIISGLSIASVAVAVALVALAL